MNQDILTDVLTQPLAVDPGYIHAYWMMLHNFMEGKAKLEGADLSQARDKNKMFVVESSSTVFINRWTNLDEVPKGSVAVISLTGPVVKNSQFCGPRGTVDIANDFQRAKSNSNIIGAVFYAETGGGMALAVKPLADAMLSFREEKPIVALTGSVIASAGYYLAVYADEIMSEHPRSIVGSIGTMMAFADVKGALEKQGVKFHEIYATESTLKNNTFNEALKGNYDPLIKNMLDPVNEDFIADVKEQRKGKIASNKAIFAGETFMASVSKELGMIDSLGNLSDAVNRVQELSRKTTYSHTKTPNNSTMEIKNLVALATAQPDQVGAIIEEANGNLKDAGIETAILVETGFLESAAAASADVTRLTEELATANTSLSTSNASLTEVQGKLDTATADLNTANEKITALEARLAALPGASHNSTEGEGNDNPPPAGNNVDDQAMIDNLPHNRNADKVLGTK